MRGAGRSACCGGRRNQRRCGENFFRANYCGDASSARYGDVSGCKRRSFDAKPYPQRKSGLRKGELVKKFYPTVRQRAISEKVSRELAGLLENVVTNGSGKQAYIEGFKVGGKTGTAQKYENGHIAVGKYVSSFVGFFPADNPRIWR